MAFQIIPATEVPSPYWGGISGGGGGDGGRPGFGGSTIGFGGFAGGPAGGSSVLDFLYGPRRRRRLGAVTALGNRAAIPFGDRQAAGMRPGIGPMTSMDWTAPLPGQINTRGTTGGFTGANEPAVGQGGFYTGDPFAPGAPWQSAGPEPIHRIENLLWNLLGQGGAAGAFDPRGSPAIAELLGQLGAQRSGAAERAAAMSAQASGVDPSQIPFLMAQGGIGARQGIGDLIASGRLQSALQNQQFTREMLPQLFQWYAGMQARERGKQLGMYDQGGFDWGSLLGGLGGTALGGFLGPAGAAFGGAAGKRLFGG